jgi:hypothetical protein
MLTYVQDYHTIYKLCYSDLQDAAQRAALSHIAAEGKRAYEEFAARLPLGPPGICLKVGSWGLTRPFASAFLGTRWAEQDTARYKLPAWKHCMAEGLCTFIEPVIEQRTVKGGALSRAEGDVRQVVSDIDDTLMSSGGSYPAGRDMRYPRDCVYPGVLAFYNELDAGHVLRIEVMHSTLILEHVLEDRLCNTCVNGHRPPRLMRTAGGAVSVLALPF